MKATRKWGPCCCGCGQSISMDDEFEIVDGEFFLEGHRGVRRPFSALPEPPPAQSPTEPSADLTDRSRPPESAPPADDFGDLPLFSQR